MEWTRNFNAAGARAQLGAAGVAPHALPAAPGHSSRAAENSFALKYKKNLQKKSLEILFFFFLKHSKKKKKGEEDSVMVSSSEIKPIAQSLSWGRELRGDMGKRGGRLRDCYIGEQHSRGMRWGGEVLSRKKAEGCSSSGWDTMHISPGARARCTPGPSPPRHPSPVQIEALSNTQGSYAYCDRCKADCRDNSLHSHTV